MKHELLATLLSSLLSQGADHAQIAKNPVVPEKCPSVSILADAGLDHVTPNLTLAAAFTPPAYSD